MAGVPPLHMMLPWARRAQWAERPMAVQKVVGSSPIIRFKTAPQKRGFCQLGVGGMSDSELRSRFFF